MIKLAICDDEKNVRNYLMSLIREQNVECEITEYASANEYLSSGMEHDLLFLDIELKDSASGMDGMGMARQIRNMKQIRQPVIIFVTGYSAFNQKVYKAIEDIPWSGKLAGGEVKGNGVFIHEDGTGGYYLEFDWGDEEDGKKTKKSKVVYADSSELENLNILEYDELNNVGFQADALLSLMSDTFNIKKEK